MKLTLDIRKNTFDWKIMCCDKEPKVTFSKRGRCHFIIHLKCKICNKRGILKYFYQEHKKADEIDKKCGIKDTPEERQYSFEVE